MTPGGNTALQAAETIGPVVIRGQRNGTWTGECAVCPPTDSGLFTAASVESGRTMAHRHFLLAHPDYELVV